MRERNPPLGGLLETAGVTLNSHCGQETSDQRQLLLKDLETLTSLAIWVYVSPQNGLLARQNIRRHTFPEALSTP